MITAHGDIDTAIKAMKSGAYDFINKPFELDEMILLVQKANNEIKLSGEVEHLRERLFIGSQDHNIIGSSPAISKVVNLIEKVSAIEDSTILIRGESGTGKELVAKAVHNLSSDKTEPFIDINCSAFPEHLLESELFGHEKGAFTDAKSRKLGLIELADEGTLFLDEVGEFPLNLQAKLLRFLETRSFRRIGGASEIKVKVRIVAATNRNLEDMVKSGDFREDLYYRLNVIPIDVPALRDRESDMIMLAEYFTEFFAQKFGRDKLILSNQVKLIFQKYEWPGNVRELKNMIERLAIMSVSHVINPEDLPSQMLSGQVAFDKEPKAVFTKDMNLDDYLAKVEYELIQDAIVKAKGVKSEAADLLGISRHSLKRRLARLEQDKD
jgi:two-component system response regulator AtoC